MAPPRVDVDGTVRVSRWSMERALVFVVLTAGLAAACSRPSPGRADAGATGGNDAGSPVAARQSFDVVATIYVGTLDVGDAGAPSTLQAPPFTLVLDPEAGHAFVGGGTNVEVPLTTGASGDLDLGPFTVSVVATTISTQVAFTGAEVAASTAALSGTGSGPSPDCPKCPFLAQLTGVPDVTPPKLLGFGAPANPFVSFGVGASEPLLPTAAARLVGEDGTAIDLVPAIVSGDFVTGFDKPNVVLPTGVGLTLGVDQVVDFPGLHASSDPPLRFAYFPTPPLVPQDGFESATGATLGGADVVGASSSTDGGTAPDAGVGGPHPISGMRSVYVGGRCAPSPTGAMVDRSLFVRLAVPAGATKLEFSYQFVAFAGLRIPGLPAASGTVRVGSVGKTPFLQELASLNSDVLMSTDPWPDGRSLAVTGVGTEEVALPSDVTSEVLVQIDADSSCGSSGGPVGNLPGGVLIDDLRVE